jgi:TM2 domain-containing membrane protein YozV
MQGITRNSWGLSDTCKSLFIGVCLLFTFGLTQSAYAQEVIKKGVLELNEESVSPKLNGRDVVPPLEDNEGMIRLTVEENDYFDIDDVAKWLKDGRITLLQIKFDRSNISVRRDESILIRFNFNYLQGQDHVARKVQIKVDDFNTYFRSQRFYKQQVAVYKLKVAEAPTYDQPLQVTGTLKVETNIEGAEVIVINSEGGEAGRRFVFDKSASFEVPIGTYQVIARKSGFDEQQIADVRVSKDEETLRVVELEESSSAANSPGNYSTVSFETNVDRTDITVIAEDGTQQRLTAFSKTAKTQLPPGNYDVFATLSGFEDFNDQITVPADSSISRSIRMVKTGNLESLKIVSQPSNAKVTINGEDYGTTPVTIRDLERKPYEITLEKENYKTYTEEVDFAIQNSYTLDHKLKDSYIRITTRPSGAKVVINGEEKGTTPFNWSNPEWKEYDIRVERELYEPIEETVDLGKVGGYSLNRTLNKKVSEVTLASSESPVPMDIQIVGEGITKTYSRSAITNVELPYGSYQVFVERPGFKPVEKRLFVNEQQFNFNYNVEHKKKGVAVALSTFLPGVGQYYWGHSGRGTLTLLVEAAAIGGSIYFLGDYTSKRDTYNELRSEYRTATDQTLINEKATAMQSAYEDMQSSRDLFLTAASVAAGTWALNIIDRLLIPSPTRIIRKSNKRSDLSDDSAANLDVKATGNGLAFRINF